MEDGLRVVVNAETPDSEDLSRTLDEAPEVHSYEVLRTNQDGRLLQLKAAEHAPRVAARTAGMLPQYPMIFARWMANHRNDHLVGAALAAQSRIRAGRCRVRSALSHPIRRDDRPFD